MAELFDFSPIILIGSQRSGTTWLGHALQKASELAYWGEPRHVWSYGNYFRPDDVLLTHHATPRIVKYIRERFWEHTTKCGKQRFSEKTPSNCFRIPFIRVVFPHARFVFIHRDGRAAFSSALETQKKNISGLRLKKRLREARWRELPAYYDRIPALWRKFTHQPQGYFGVRPPGWKTWQRTYSKNEIAAKQWATSNLAALEAFEEVGEEQLLQVAYEDMVTRPETAEQFAEFLRLEDPTPVINFLRESARPERAEAWRQEVPAEVLTEIRPHMDQVLSRFGYDW